MARMDLSDSQIFGDEIEIWDAAPASKTDEPEESSGSSTDPATRKKKIDAQDRVVIIQTVLAVTVILLFLAVKFVFPKLHETLNEQYTAFNTKPPIFDLDDIKKLVTPEAAITLPPQYDQASRSFSPESPRTEIAYAKI